MCANLQQYAPLDPLLKPQILPRNAMGPNFPAEYLANARLHCAVVVEPKYKSCPVMSS